MLSLIIRAGGVRFVNMPGRTILHVMQVRRSGPIVPQSSTICTCDSMNMAKTNCIYKRRNYQNFLPWNVLMNVLMHHMFYGYVFVILGPC